MALNRGVLTVILIVFCTLEWDLNSNLAEGAPQQKVSLELYYETLCPYCSNFIVNHLGKIFNNSLLDIVDLKLIPYGNARVAPDNTIVCQHGPNECLLNTVEACVIDAYPDLHKNFAFIYCVENLVVERKYTEWQSCSQKTGVDSQSIVNCFNNGRGKELELQYAAITNALQPPHTYVPWVVVDGKPLYEDYENFMSYVCKAYKGTVPVACKTLSLEMQEKKLYQLRPVCYPKQSRHIDNPPETSDVKREDQGTTG